jgi:hypothetical protein
VINADTFCHSAFDGSVEAPGFRLNVCTENATRTIHAKQFRKFLMRKQTSPGDESVSDAQLAAQLRALRRDDPGVVEILVSCSYVGVRNISDLNIPGMLHCTSSKTEPLFTGGNLASRASSM